MHIITFKVDDDYFDAFMLQCMTKKSTGKVRIIKHKKEDAVEEQIIERDETVMAQVGEIVKRKGYIDSSTLLAELNNRGDKKFNNGALTPRLRDAVIQEYVRKEHKFWFLTDKGKSTAVWRTPSAERRAAAAASDAAERRAIPSNQHTLGFGGNGQ